MENKFINHISQLTSCLALVLFFIVGYYQNFMNGIGILIGASWGLVNLYFLKKSLQEWLNLSSRNYLRFYTLLQIKFPLLYLTGYGLFRMKIFPVITLVSGFSLIFLAIFILSLIKILLESMNKSKMIG